MKIVLQRVLEAEIAVDSQKIAQIGKGLLVFLGITTSDTETIVKTMVDKISRLRIFADDDGKSNLSINDIGGEILIVSQFTLYADTRKGNRPSFIEAAQPQHANAMYECFIEYCRGKFAKVEAGIFAADMKVRLINDGPYTIVMNS